MSIDIDEFEEGTPDSWEEPTNAERVLAFLSDRSDRAWTQSAIAERAGVKRGSIGSVLARLEDRDLVRHKGRYWAITNDRERLRAAIDQHRITAALDERYGSERKSEWREHAADDPE